MFGLEYRPADGHRIFGKVLYSNFNDSEERNQYVFLIDDAISGDLGVDGGDLVGVGVRGMFNLGEYKNHNLIYTIGGDHLAGGWDLNWRLNYTETENTTDLPIVLQNQITPSAFVSMRYDRTDPNFPLLDLYQTEVGAGGISRGDKLTTLDQTNFGYMMAMPVVSGVETSSWVYKLDGRRDIQFAGRNVQLALGLEYNTREVEGAAIATSTLPLSAYLPRVGMTYNPADYLTDRNWPGSFPRGFDVKWVDNHKMRRDLDQMLAAFAQAGLYDPNSIDPVNSYQIDEELIATYASAKFDVGPAHIVAGLRVEHIGQDIAGYIGNADLGYTPLNSSQSDTSVFPSINAKFDLNEDMVLRLSAQTGISRPSFSVVRTSASIDDTNRVISAGNPYLEPERTWGTDVSLEYYLPGSGVASVSGFYRNVSNVLFDSSILVTDDTYDVAGMDRTGYQFQSTLNGGDGKLYGIELNYMQQFVFLPAGWDAFGFQGNLSLLAGDFETPDGRIVDFPGVSNTIMNASVFYENHGLSARLSYQWRSDWIDTLSLNGWGDQTRKGYENLDLSVRYAINDNISLYFDANNLTDETYIAFEGDLDHPTEVEQIGRRYLAGLRFSF